MEIKWIGVDCGSADHPMNTKIRDWEPMEAEACDKIFMERYGKHLNEIYEWPKNYQAMHIQLFCQPYEAIHAECLGGEIDKLSNQRCVIGWFPLEIHRGRELHQPYCCLHRLRGRVKICIPHIVHIEKHLPHTWEGRLHSCGRLFHFKVQNFFAFDKKHGILNL